MMTHLPTYGLVTLLVLSGCSGKKENSQGVEPPESVRRFFEVHGAMQEAMQDVISSVPTVPGERAKGRDIVKEWTSEHRLEQLLAMAKNVKTDELNEIYPEWGDRFKADLLPGIELLLNCVRQRDKAECAKASAYLRAWDDWLARHWDPLVERLHERYGLETRGPASAGKRELTIMAKFVYILLAWLAGVVTGAFLLSQAIICLAFGIPFTYRMKSLGYFTSTAPAKRYMASSVLLLGLFAVASWAMWHFFPTFIFWGYAVGVTLTVVPSLGKCGRTKANVWEFLETNARYVNPDAMTNPELIGRWVEELDDVL